MTAASRFRRIGLLVPLVVVCTLASGYARAARVTWDVSGTVDYIDRYEAELSLFGVFVGTPFTASFTFQTATPRSDWSSSPYMGCCGSFYGAVLEASFEAGEYSVSFSPPSYPQNAVWSPYDVHRFSMSAGGSGPTTLLAPFLLLSFFNTEEANGYESVLPIDPPVTAGMNRELMVFTSDRFWSIHASDVSIVVSVPEPGTSSGFVVVAAALAARVAGRRLGAARP